MPLRRRPLARAAVVGGVAYSAGKRREAGQQQDAETDARLADLEAQAAAQPAPAAPAPAGRGMSDQTIQQLKDLAALHEQGVLTDEEFAAQKAKILGG